MKKLVSLLIIIFAFQACSSDDSETPEDVLFLTQMEDEIRHQLFTFDYNADSTVNSILFTQWDWPETWEFEYAETTKMISEVSISDGESHSTLEFIYSDNNKLEIINEWKDEAIYSSLAYTYGSNGKPQTLTYTFRDWEEIQEVEFTWEGDNLVSYETGGNTYEFTYDNNPNRLGQIGFYNPYMPIVRNYNFGGSTLANKNLELLSKNNCTSTTVNLGEDWIDHFATTWSFNEFLYPTISRVVSGDTLSSRKVFTYSQTLPR